jgi:hypothetical protein
MENEYLGVDYYERLKNSYDEKLYRQEVLGEYLPVSAGLVYDSFNRDNNVAPVTVDPGTELLWTLDFNVNPMCSLVPQRFGDIVKVLDEIVLKNARTTDACDEFLERYPRTRRGCEFVATHPHITNRHRVGRITT